MMRPLLCIGWRLGGVVAGLALVHLSIEGLVQFVQDLGRRIGDSTLVEPFLGMRAVVPTIAAIGFGAYRIFARHPIFRPEYRRWLEHSPWTPSKPLPAGGIQPHWLDPLLVGLLCWLASGGSLEVLTAPVFGYVVAFLTATCIVAHKSHQRAILFTLLLGMGLAIRLASDVVGPLFVLLAICPLAMIGLRQSLDPKRWPTLSPSNWKVAADRQSKSTGLGWPFEFLSPKELPQRLTRSDRVAVSVLIGWYAYCILSIIPPGTSEDQRNTVTLFAFCVIIASGVRLFAYAARHEPPISIAGRIATRRWIIPGYDQIFVSPLATLAAFALGEGAIGVFQVPFHYGQPMVLAACTFLLLVLGPSLRTWDLTGSHRIVPGGSVNAANGYLKV